MRLRTLGALGVAPGLALAACAAPAAPVSRVIAAPPAAALSAEAAPLQPPAPAASPFVLVGDAPKEHYDFAGQSLLFDGERLGIVEGTSIAHPPELPRGLRPGPGWIEAAGGTWPSNAWVALTGRGESVVYRFHGDGWIEERAARRPSTVTYFVAAWPDGRALLLRARSTSPRLQATERASLQIAGNRPLEHEVRRSAPAILVPHALRTRDDGTIVVVGEPWADLNDPPPTKIERWGPREVDGHVETLPDAKGAVVHDVCLVARGGTVVVGDREGQWQAWLHDGTRWSIEHLPAGTTSAACADDGGIFAVVGGAVQRRVGPERWQPIDLPAVTPPWVATGLWAGASGALWVEAEGGGGPRPALFRMPLPAAQVDGR